MSNNLFNRAKEIFPGGVHSPVRSFKGLNRSPIFIKKAKGAYIYDVEDKNYIDFCMSFGPLILGHKDPDVETSLKEALTRGWTFGTCEPYSIELATEILEKIKFIDQIRFVNSGTEAVMTAIRLARGYTGKDKIIKFSGCYHGHTDSMLIKAGSGLAGTTEASSKGIPASIAEDTLVLELGDTKGVRNLFEQYPESIAGIIIEPLPANMGLLPQRDEFLTYLREITKKYGALLIMDEVISGFRVSFGGCSEVKNIIPDIVTYGKIIGGGLPVGAIGGRKEIMQKLAPVGDVYQAGTLSANPLAMVAGTTTLKKLTPENYTKIDSYSTQIVSLLRQWLVDFNSGQFSDLKITQEGSLFWIASKDNASNATEIPSDLTERFDPLFKELLSRGIYLSPNAYEVGFVSLAHNDEVIKELQKRLYS